MRKDFLTSSYSMVVSFTQQISFLILMLGMLFSSNLSAEGTEQISPTLFDRMNLAINPFASYDGPADQRLYVHIENSNDELVYLGFSQPVNYAEYPCLSGACCINGSFVGGITGYFRIKDPAGNIVFGPQILDGTTSNINTWADAVGGPNQIVGSGGYDGFSFDPSGLTSGDYYIEFTTSQTDDGTHYFEWWDITVANKTANTAIEGRVFSKQWAFHAPDSDCNFGSVPYGPHDRTFLTELHVYSPIDSIASIVDFRNSGLRSGFFNLNFNSTGTGNSGVVLDDRKSINGEPTYGDLFLIFLNDPDVNIYPSGTYGTYDTSPLVNSCDNLTADYYISVTKPGQIEILIDLDNPGGLVYTPNSADVILVQTVKPQPGEIPPYIRKITWDGLDGLGAVYNLSQPYEYKVTYAQGVFHFPIYDAEFMLNGFEYKINRPLPTPLADYRELHFDNSNISFSSGTGIPTVEIDGCLAPCLSWSNSDFGNDNTINTWFFASKTIATEATTAYCIIAPQPDIDTTLENNSITVNYYSNDLGQNVDTTSFFINVPPSNGTVSNINTATGTLTYTPSNGFIGTEVFEYTLCDTTGIICLNVPITIEVTPMEDCTNGIDDDGDGLIDCADPDCNLLTTPGSISGNTSICGNSIGENFSVASVPGATSYNWTLPSDAVITSGAGTESIIVTWGITDGDVCVEATDGICPSSQSCLIINSIGIGSIGNITKN